MSKVVIMVGCPGAGKSTYIKNNYPSAFIASADHYFMQDGVYEFDRSKLGRAHEKCFTTFSDALEFAGEELIVVDNTNTTMKEINVYANPAKLMEYDVEIVIIKTSPRVGYKRNVHGVPLDVIEKMAARVENTEKLLAGWNVIIVNNE